MNDAMASDIDGRQPDKKLTTAQSVFDDELSEMFRFQRHWPNAIRPGLIVDLGGIFIHNGGFQ